VLRFRRHPQGFLPNIQKRSPSFGKFTAGEPEYAGSMAAQSEYVNSAAASPERLTLSREPPAHFFIAFLSSNSK
jgi:hypothetical protein